MKKKEKMVLAEMHIDDLIREMEDKRDEIAQKTLDKSSLRKIKGFARKLDLFEVLIPDSITDEDKKIEKILENDKEWRKLLGEVEQLLSRAKKLKQEGKEVARIFLG